MPKIKICPAGGIAGKEVEYNAESLNDFIIEFDGHKVRCKYVDGRLYIPGFHIGSLNVGILPNSFCPSWVFDLI